MMTEAYLRWLPEDWPCPQAWKHSLARKIKKSRQVIQEWAAKTTKRLVAYSGGKDSTVVLDLVMACGLHDVRVETVVTDEGFLPGIDEMWLYAGQRYGADVRRFNAGSLFAWYEQFGLDNLTRVDAAWKAAIERHEDDLGIDGVARGIRADESRARRMMLRRYGLMRETKRGRLVIDPIGWWTVRDVWVYHFVHQLPYHRHYDEGAQHEPRDRRRIGDPFGTCGSAMGRLWALKQWYPEQYEVFMQRFPEVRDYT